jgi:hypothetical protein
MKSCSKYFGQKGKFTFLFDGFDEVSHYEQQRVLQAIKGLADRYQTCKVIISSRFSSRIVSAAWCKYVDILPIQKYDVPDIIVRLAGIELGESILSKIRAKPPKLFSLLTSPLMIALLIVRYRVEQTVPETDVAFFSDLFDLLLRRHDQGKEGFRRQRRSSLGDLEMCNVFGGVSYLSSTQLGSSEFAISTLTCY